MNTPFTFSKTVIGYSHIRKNTPTEDASAHYSDPEGRYYIAVISDGHGDKNCFRSSLGSEYVVVSAMKSLKTFAEGILFKPERYKDFLADKTVQQRYIKNLTNSIFTSWHSMIQQNLQENPPTEQEYAQCAPNIADMYRSGHKTAHIYGATLIAAIKIHDFLLLLQQGDGRCDVFYADGSVDQPIPWDDRCHENVTTSMCDSDAHLSIRSCIIDTAANPVIACYVGSDGVEDSFPDNDDIEQNGTHRFYKELTCHIIDRYENESDLYAFFEEHFSTLSRIGSADDVSVSGIVFIEQCKGFYERFKNEVFAYEYDYKIADIEAKIAGAQRKHSILKQRMLDAKSVYDKACASYDKKLEEYENLQIELANLIKEREERESEYAQKKRDAKDAKEKTRDILSKNAFFDLLPDTFFKKIAAILDVAKQRLDRAVSLENRKRAEVEQLSRQLDTFRNTIEGHRRTWESTKAEFEAFDKICQGHIQQRDELKKQKQSLLNPDAADAPVDAESQDKKDDVVLDATVQDDTPTEPKIPSYFTESTAPFSDTEFTVTPAPERPAPPVIHKVSISDIDIPPLDSDDTCDDDTAADSN